MTCPDIFIDLILANGTGFYGGSAQYMMDRIVFATSGQTVVEPYRNDDETKRVANEDGMNSIRRMLSNDRKQLLHPTLRSGNADCLISLFVRESKTHN